MIKYWSARLQGLSARQVASDEKRAVGVADHHHPLVLVLEVLDRPVQDPHAYVHLGLQLVQAPLGISVGQVVIEGEGLMHLDELYVIVFRKVAEIRVPGGIELVQWAALFEDPHRIGVKVSGHLE